MPPKIVHAGLKPQTLPYPKAYAPFDAAPRVFEEPQPGPEPEPESQEAGEAADAAPGLKELGTRDNGKENGNY